MSELNWNTPVTYCKFCGCTPVGGSPFPLQKTFATCGCPCHWKDVTGDAKSTYLKAVLEYHGASLSEALGHASTDLLQRIADVLDDDLENRAARHSLGKLHAEVQYVLRKREGTVK
jgi:hypothetical protein